MSDSGKIKKNYKLMGTESDPVIIAQRLLNLYRQLHIFSPEKKEAYNKMLMEQTSEVKKTLGTLPGGIVVQQYLADIEAEAGVAVEEFEHETTQADADNYNNAVPHVAMPATISVASDPEMIKEIVDTFKEAIVTSEKNRKEDTKELAQTIIALQSKMVQTMMSKNKGFSAAGTGEGGGFDGTQLESIVETLSKAQATLIKELAQNQTKELSVLIGNVLKEIQQMSTQSMIDAVEKVHRENMNFFKNQFFTSVSSMPMGNMEPISLDESHDFISEPISKKEPQKAKEAIEEPISLDETDISFSEPPSVKNSNDYEWEYVDDGNGKTNTSGADNNDYEWEYVDDGNENETIPQSPIDGIEELSLDDSEDLSFEEEKSPEKTKKEDINNEGGIILSEENQSGVFEGENNEDYEWEYVDEGDETVVEDNSTSVVENSEDYEWEYVDEESGAIEEGDSEYIEDEASYDYQGNNDNNVMQENWDGEEFPDKIELDDSFGLSSNDDI